MKWLFILVLALASLAGATTYRDLSLDELVARAELVFFGAVSGVATEERDGEPFTVVTFSVSRPLLGELGETETLAFYGGTLPDGRTLEVEGMPQFTRGDEVLVMAYDAPYYSPIVGFSQGVWRAQPEGFEDEAGRFLSLNDSGTLTRDGEGSDRNEVLAALETRLEEAQ